MFYYILKKILLNITSFIPRFLRKIYLYPNYYSKGTQIF